MDDDKLNPFSIDNKKAFEVIFDMLIEISARQRASEELFYKDVKTEEELNEVFRDLNKTVAFHKRKVYEYLFSHYSFLGDILPPKVDPSKD